MKNEIEELIEDISNHLKYKKMMGVTTVPKSKSLKTQKPGPAKQPVSLEDVQKEIGDCKRCKLHKGRTKIVFGVGNPKADLMFIGEGPGRDEDIQGEPFVGRAGKLLTKIIEAMKLKRSDVYIGNIVKCRPPQNRNPEPDETETCIPFLLKQIEAIRPKVLVCLGAVATKLFLETEVPISKLRGKLIDWESPKIEGFSCKLIPTYHPAFLLRNPAMKRPVWEDMQVVMNELGLKIPNNNI